MKKIILLVEDDHDLRRILRDVILDDGVYDVVDLPDGLVALNWLAVNPRPAIIVSDYLMAGKGSDLAKAARSANLNTIIITGNRDEALEALRAHGLVVPVLTKPFDPYDLLSIVDKLAGTSPEPELKSKLSGPTMKGTS